MYNLFVLSIFLYYLNVNANLEGQNATISNIIVALEFNNNTINDIKPITNNESQPENVTETFDKLLFKISNYCLSKQDYEEIYGNKSRYGLIMTYVYPVLMDEALEQIGLNELRKIFNLKPQTFNDVDRDREINDNITSIEEPIQETNDKDFCKNLLYFQKKVDHSYVSIFAAFFWAKDIDVAEAFLVKKFPDIRQMFCLKYQEVAEKFFNGTISFEKATIDKMYEAYLKTQDDILEATRKMHKQSYKGILSPKLKSNLCNKS